MYRHNCLGFSGYIFFNFANIYHMSLRIWFYKNRLGPACGYCKHSRNISIRWNYDFISNTKIHRSNDKNQSIQTACHAYGVFNSAIRCNSQRLILRRIAEAEAVQMKGRGSLLCSRT